MKTNKLKQQKGTLLRVLQYVKPYRVLVIVSLLRVRERGGAAAHPDSDRQGD